MEFLSNGGYPLSAWAPASTSGGFNRVSSRSRPLLPRYDLCGGRSCSALRWSRCLRLVFLGLTCVGGWHGNLSRHDDRVRASEFVCFRVCGLLFRRSVLTTGGAFPGRFSRGLCPLHIHRTRVVCPGRDRPAWPTSRGNRNCGLDPFNRNLGTCCDCPSQVGSPCVGIDHGGPPVRDGCRFCW